MKFSNVILIGTLALAGCEQQTPNGQIPDKYVPEAQKLVGDYKGSMDGGQAGTLSIRLSGTKVIAKFSKGLLECGGTIGDLTSVDASSTTVDKATFALKGAAKCVDGQSIAFGISQDLRTLSASVHSGSSTSSVCPSQSDIDSCQAVWQQRVWDCDNETDAAQKQLCQMQNNNGAQGCSACTDQTEQYYVSGTFRK